MEFENCTTCGESVGRPTMPGYKGKMMCLSCIQEADEVRWQEEISILGPFRERCFM